MRVRGALPRLAWYRFVATVRRRWAGYLGLAVLTGLVGGVAMGSMVAARRTDSSYPQFLAGTNPSDLVVQPFTTQAYSPGFVRQLARLPHVSGVAVAVPLTAATITRRGRVGTVLLAHVQLAATISGGLFASQDRVTITAGRRPDPARPDEVLATVDAARLLHLHVGSRLRVALIASTTGGPAGRIDLTVVGIGVLGTQVLQDSIDSGRTGFLIGTPALAAKFASCCASGMITGLRVTDGPRYSTTVAREYDRLLATSPYISPSGSELYVYLTSAIEAEAQRAIRPEAIALAVFGLIAGLAAVILGTQSIGRQLRAGADDAGALRALGAGPLMIIADGLPGILAAVAAGAVLAIAVALALSPFSLFGPVREVVRGRGLYPDWAVLGLGALTLSVVLAGLATVIAYRQVPHRLAARGRAASRRPSAARTAVAAGLPVSGTEGVRLALEPGHGRTAVPVRSVLAGRGLDSNRDVVLGPATLAALHQRVGGIVTLASGSFRVRLTIAGTATMPAIGGALSIHPSMSTGALFSAAILPEGSSSGPFGAFLAGPNAILVRLRPGTSPAAGLQSLQAIGRQLTAGLKAPRTLAESNGSSIADTIDLLPAQRPAEIVNYKTMGAMPAVLAAGLAAGAVAGLGLTLVASVRRRRRDFALLKTLGFTRGQLAGAVAWQSSVIAVVGLLIGVPVGVALGRLLWLAFARELSAVPDAVIPAGSIALAALAALVLANLVAALPGRAAGRTPAAIVLRAE